MHINSLLEVITAAHLSDAVEVSPKMQVRGGIMLVAPPASLKSSVINHLEQFPNALVLSDSNVRQFMQIRDNIAAGDITTLALLEFGKIYQRQQTTSDNLEGHIAAMVDEGFKHGANEDQRMTVRVARSLVVAGMTYDLYRRKYTQWKDSGFARRFIWCQYVLKDRHAIKRAIHKWEPLDIIGDPIIFGLPPNTIPYSLNEKESGHIAKMLRRYTEIETPYILLKKIACVLAWRHSTNKKDPRTGIARSMEILEDFAECLGQNGAELEI